MKRIRYHFKSREIKVVKVKDILTKKPSKLPHWVQEGLGLRNGRRVLWIAGDTLHYWTNYGGCTLPLKAKDFLIRIPLPEHYGKNKWEITGYLQEKFRKNIERF